MPVPIDFVLVVQLIFLTSCLLYALAVFKVWTIWKLTMADRPKHKCQTNSNKMMDFRADKLRMDFIRLPFLDFLWGYTFIGPCTVFLYRKGVTMMRIRNLLVKWKLITVPKCDYEIVAAKLCLESTQAIHYTGTDKSKVAHFEFVNFSYVDSSCKHRTGNLLAVEIDLTSKRFSKAAMDGVDVTAKEASILLFFNNICSHHVRLHGLANYGCNHETTDDSFLCRNAVVTIMYNYFGYTNFNTCFPQWVKHGIISEGWASSDKPWMQAADNGLANKVPYHAHVSDLIKYSRTVKFMVLVRDIFLTEFNKHRRLFPDIDAEVSSINHHFSIPKYFFVPYIPGSSYVFYILFLFFFFFLHIQAMFVGTVLHSLDHTVAGWNMEDPFWLDVDDPKFGKTAEAGRVVRVGFLSDVPGLYFHKRFKGSGHPFYEAVYKKAAKIDKKFADMMDTCIIK